MSSFGDPPSRAPKSGDWYTEEECRQLMAYAPTKQDEWPAFLQQHLMLAFEKGQQKVMTRLAGMLTDAQREVFEKDKPKPPNFQNAKEVSPSLYPEYDWKAQQLDTAFRAHLELAGMNAKALVQRYQRTVANALISAGVCIIPSDVLEDHQFMVSRGVYDAAVNSELHIRTKRTVVNYGKYRSSRADDVSDDE